MVMVKKVQLFRLLGCSRDTYRRFCVIRDQKGSSDDALRYLIDSVSITPVVSPRKWYYVYRLIGCSEETYQKFSVLRDVLGSSDAALKFLLDVCAS